MLRLSLWPENPSHGFVAVAVATITLVIFSILRRYLYPIHPKTIPGPLQTVIPGLDDKQIAALDYPPDSFPGGRDVQTPYGSMRVYEWGPTTGRKVLFVHGISTSCQTLAKLAQGVVARGHRVMLFDLFGRGFSDGVGDLPHDARLYVSQALCALASSPLAWMGDDGFDLVGYSLGGGVSVHFAAAFPQAIRSLILLAPAGMIRPESFGVAARFVFTAGLVPERLLAFLTRKRLQKPIANSAVKRRGGSPTPSPPPEKQRNGNGSHKQNGNGATKHNGKSNGHNNGKINGKSNGYEEGKQEGKSNGHGILHDHTHHTQLATSEVLPPPEDDSDGKLFSPNEPGDRLEKRVTRYVRWQLSNHAGFVPAFMGCIREGPLMGQEDTWKRLGQVRTPNTTCVILAEDDELIDADHYASDALPLLGGPSRVRWRVIPRCSHDFVMTHADQALREIDRFWENLPPSPSMWNGNKRREKF